MRFMFGSIFTFELLRASRRNPNLLARLWTGWLILQVCVLCLFYETLFLKAPFLFGERSTTEATHEFGRMCLIAFVTQGVLAAGLAVPAFVVSSIAREKSCNTLSLLLTTRLTSTEIVVGKMLAGLVQTVRFVLPGLPFLCFFGVFGGLDGRMLASILVITATLVFTLATFSALATVSSKRRPEAIFGVYSACGLIGLIGHLVIHWDNSFRSLSGPSDSVVETLLHAIGNVVRSVDPVSLLETTLAGDVSSGSLYRLFVFAVGWGAVGLGCLTLAVRRFRSASIRQMKTTRKSSTGCASKRCEVSDDPIRWKEREVDGLAVLALLRRCPKWLAVAAISMLTVIDSCVILRSYLPGHVSDADVLHAIGRGDFSWLASIESAWAGFLGQTAIAMALFLLAVVVRCSLAISGERENSTWEALLLTSLEPDELLRGKLWGVLQATYPYLFAYALPAIPLSLLGGISAFLLTVFGFLIAIPFLIGVGTSSLCWSCRRKTSTGTLRLALGYVYAPALLFFIPILSLASLSGSLPFAAISKPLVILLLCPILLVVLGTFWLSVRGRSVQLKAAEFWISSRD